MLDSLPSYRPSDGSAAGMTIRLARQTFLNRAAGFGHVELAGVAGFEFGHDFAHFFDVFDVQFGDEAIDGFIDFGFGHLLGHEFLDDGDLADFAVIEIDAVGAFIGFG